MGWKGERKLWFSDGSPFARMKERRRGASYLQRHLDRIESCLAWLEERATPDGFVPGWFSIMDVNLAGGRVQTLLPT